MLPVVKIKEDSKWASLAALKLGAKSVAMVLGHTIHLHNVSREDFLRQTKWVRHELKHIEQVRRMGIFSFMIVYLWETIRKGYYNNKLEVEARAAENDETLLQQFDFYNKKNA